MAITKQMALYHLLCSIFHDVLLEALKESDYRRSIGCLGYCRVRCWLFLPVIGTTSLVLGR